MLLPGIEPVSPTQNSNHLATVPIATYDKNYYKYLYITRNLVLPGEHRSRCHTHIWPLNRQIGWVNAFMIHTHLPAHFGLGSGQVKVALTVCCDGCPRCGQSVFKASLPSVVPLKTDIPDPFYHVEKPCFPAPSGKDRYIHSDEIRLLWFSFVGILEWNSYIHRSMWLNFYFPSF